MRYGRDLSFIYNNPTRIIFGEQTVREAGLEVESLGGSRALIVTDQGVVAAGLAEMVQKALGRRYAGTFAGCLQDSGLHIVNEGAVFAREVGADVLVSVGGGSTIDTTKGIAVLLKEGGQLQDYAGYQLLSRPQTPHLAIPTTAGTGSEVTYAAIIKDWENNTKILFCDNHLIPNVAIIDPLLTRDLPPLLTATTGMDALTHAMEAIHSTEREPLADAMALHAIMLILEYLPRCVEQGEDLQARGQQQLAATMAGIAFNNTQVALVHAMAHSVGALFHVPHGLANSILLPHVIVYNLDYCADSYALIARAMGLAVPGMSNEEAGTAVAEAVWALTKKMGVPQRLREAGVPQDGLEAAANRSLSDGSIIYNPKPATTVEEILEVYYNAW
ncbi:MAG: iron-containing alcohol dehydrogenase [Firmicutes bacterium]|jgi:alcohol dehydrogenase|nr:iron-containing alcohol dehydrogenase [Dethiobacter sp.]MBS3897559.1 iron-containing alcohol dehydrogenase [Dethiobacter sp.]MCL4462465.1 iron-containing alcohol dehydrogenase [Bacillota bacterium]MCL5993653.1 iron-containing alcohol dehydrogenase [Bacillota bacterium]